MELLTSDDWEIRRVFSFSCGIPDIDSQIVFIAYLDDIMIEKMYFQGYFPFAAVVVFCRAGPESMVSGQLFGDNPFPSLQCPGSSCTAIGVLLRPRLPRVRPPRPRQLRRTRRWHAG